MTSEGLNRPVTTAPLSPTQPARPIILVSLVYYPDTSASGLLFTDLFSRLAAEGADVTVLCGFPSKDGQEQVRDLPRRERVAGVQIVRCGLRLQGKRSLWTRMLAYLSFSLHAGWHLVRSGRSARVVGGTDPPFTPLALWAVSRPGRFRYECLLLDLYPDGLTALGGMGETSYLVRLWRWLNRRSFAGAARIVVIGRDMVTLLQRRYGVAPSRVEVIPHWGISEVDREQRAAENGAPDGGDDSRGGDLLESMGLRGKFVVQYSGNMGLWHDMDTMVRAAHRLRDVEDIHFLFIGKGRRRAAAEDLARRLELRNITWKGFLPRERLAQSLAACDVSLISLREGLEGVAVPSKLYGILASGRAVIAQVPRDSEVAYVVTEEDCGVVVAPGDVEGLARAIQELSTHPDRVAVMQRNALKAYRAKYTLDLAVRRYARLWDLPIMEPV